MNRGFHLPLPHTKGSHNFVDSKLYCKIPMSCHRQQVALWRVFGSSITWRFNVILHFISLCLLHLPQQPKYSSRHPRLPFKTGPTLAGTALVTMILLLLLPWRAKPIVLVIGICVLGVIVTSWLAGSVLTKDDGTPAMRAVSDPIKVCLGVIAWYGSRQKLRERCISLCSIYT